MMRRTYVAKVTAPGALAEDFEQMLDVLGAAAMEGADGDEEITLWFDVRARSSRRAVEKAYLSISNIVTRSPGAIALSVTRDRRVAGRRPFRP